MNYTMRNNSGDPPHRTLEKKINHHIKSLVKLPSQSFGKESIFHKLIDLGENRKEDSTPLTPNKYSKAQQMRKINEIPAGDASSKIHKSEKNRLENLHCNIPNDGGNNKSINDYQASFLYSESVKAAIIQRKSTTDSNSKNKYSNDKMIDISKTNISNKLNAKNNYLNRMQSNSADSRVTGGGSSDKTSQDINTKLKSKLSEKNSLTNQLSKKNSKDLNPPRKVSFKIRNPPSSYRKNVLTSNKVASLTQKFNELIKENDDLSKESKIALINDNIRNHRNKLSSTSSPTTTLSTNVNLKIKSYNKISVKRKTSLKSRSSSNASIDKVEAAESPNVHRKLLRIKSDNSPKKKNFVKKKSYDSNKKVELSNSLKSNSTLTENVYPEIAEQLESKKSKHPVKRKPSFKTSPTRHSVNVRAAIQKFEHSKPVTVFEDEKVPRENEKVAVQEKNKWFIQESDISKDRLSNKEKPKVPDKKITLSKTKNLVIRDGKPKIKNINAQSHLILSSTDEDRATGLIENPRESILKTDSVLKDTEIKSKKEFIYNKVKFHKTLLKKPKLQLLSTDIYVDTISSIPDGKPNCSEINHLTTGYVDSIENTEQNDSTLDSISEDEKLYQEVSARIKPNESFLWRAYSKNDMIPSKESGVKLDLISEDDNLYDLVGPSIIIMNCESAELQTKTATPQDEAICPSFETFLKKTDDLLDNKKREIAEDLKKEKKILSGNDSCNEAFNLEIQCSEQIVEAINVIAINDADNLIQQECQKNIDEGYEPLEPYRNNLEDSQKSLNDIYKSHNKSNCPLPEVPRERGQYSYKYLPNERIECDEDEDNISNHSYEYCASKMNTEKFYNNESDDGYEYCKSPKDSIKKKSEESSNQSVSSKVKGISVQGYSIIKSNSPTSSLGYEKISSIYESIPPRTAESELQYSKHHLNSNSNYSEHGINYDECNCDENIYDTIKLSDTISESNCYESIPGSPNSVIRMGHKSNTKYLPQLLTKSHIPFDSISNFSQSYSGSTISSENKTNSIYGQRSIVSSIRSEATIYGNAPSEISSSDRSDDWVDMSDQDESITGFSKIIKRERSRGKRSPASWSRKVRHQWNKSPKKSSDPRNVDSSDSEHLYEPFPHQGSSEDSRIPQEYYDSFDSDSESEQSFHHVHKGDIDNTQLPEPPTSSNIYTLTRFASAAGKKMRELKFNFTKSTRKKHSDNGNKSTFTSDEKDNFKIKQGVEEKSKKSKEIIVKTLPDSPSQNNVFFQSKHEVSVDKPLKTMKSQHSPVGDIKSTQFPVRNALSNINLSSASQLNLELAEHKSKSEQMYSNISNTSIETQDSQNNNSKTDKDSTTLSRKSYLSFKSKFKRNSSVIDDNKSRSQSLSVMNSTFYLNDLLSDSSESKNNDSGEMETAKEESQPVAPTRKHNKKPLPEPPVQTNLNQVNDTSVPLVPGIIKRMSPVISNKNNNPKSPSIRPNGPPPPPPDNVSPVLAGDVKRLSGSKKDKRSSNTTSWYAECGLFKANEQYKPESNGNPKERTSSTSWYAEVGLYQIGNISTSSGASSTLSGGGTCSTTAPSLPDTLLPPLGMFNQEPLYQFYDAAKIESVCHEISNYSDSDGYEEIANFKEGTKNGNPVQRPSAMTLVSPQKGPSRTLWCEIPEVINSAILSTLTPNQKKLQEAMFEIISSEASYLNSLTVLESIFISHPAFGDERIISKTDKNILFGNIPPVKRCSEQLLADLEQCWQENILLRGLCEIVKTHAKKNFHVYVKYCESQVFIVKTLKKLKLDPKFNEILNQIESQPICQCLCLNSFLMLPMQRATRLPLLLDAVLKKLNALDDEYQPCLDALATLNNIVSQCNEGARNVERMEEIKNISSQIEFPSHIQEIPIISPKNDKKNSNEPQRWLVRSGELTHLVWRGEDQSKLTFGRKVTKISLYMFLFTDLLIVTKKKSEDVYVVVDYCKRSLLEITTSDMMGPSPVKESAGKYTLLLTMLENYENKTVEMLLSCVRESDRQRWMEACVPPTSSNPEETVYEGWDCPQVAAVYNYQSTQPDELNLQKGDIVNVNKKMADGWYHGERIRDGEKGWFPGTYTVEIASPHVRARNLRQRYRLLALTGNYLGQNKKK